MIVAADEGGEGRLLQGGPATKPTSRPPGQQIPLLRSSRRESLFFDTPADSDDKVTIGARRCPLHLQTSAREIVIAALVAGR